MNRGLSSIIVLIFMVQSAIAFNIPEREPVNEWGLVQCGFIKAVIQYDNVACYGGDAYGLAYPANGEIELWGLGNPDTHWLVQLIAWHELGHVKYSYDEAEANRYALSKTVMT